MVKERIVLPQTERAEILKKILLWMNSTEKGVTVQAFHFHVKWEITEGGASDKTIKKYLEDLHHAGLIENKHPFWRITQLGKEWLERHTL
jgi:predicted transcriptional regulator